MKNYDSDIYLYAKHWYKKEDLIEDLKKIIAKRCCILFEHISESDILIILSSIVCKHYFINNQNADYWFGEFIKDILPENNWRIGGNKNDSIEISIIKKMLSMISLTKIIKGDEVLIELDEPDFNLLPSSKED